MPQKERKINFLSPEWEWRYKGEQNWLTSRGKVSTERHAVNTLTGETLSVREAQNKQHQAREEAGQPKPLAQARPQKTRTIKQPTLTRKTAGTHEAPFYDPAIHGNVEVYVFRTFNDARSYTALTGLEGFKFGMLSIRYSKRLTPPPGKSDQRMTNGHATLIGFTSTAALEVGASTTVDPLPGTMIENMWNKAEDILYANFDMSTSSARFFITVFEK